MTDMAKLTRSVRAFLKNHEDKQQEVRYAIRDLKYAEDEGSIGMAKRFGASYIYELLKLESYRVTPEEGVEIALKELSDRFDEKESEDECQVCKL